MPSFDVAEAAYEYAHKECDGIYAPTTYGQMKFTTTCIPLNATSYEETKCINPPNLPKDVTCPFMFNGSWFDVSKRQKEPQFYCYTFCREIHDAAVVSSSVSPVAMASPSVNESASSAPSASPSSHSAALNLYPNSVLSFFTLLFFMFVFFKPNH